MNSNPQNNLIVTGKSQKQKRSAVHYFSSPALGRINVQYDTGKNGAKGGLVWDCCVVPQIPIRRGSAVSENCGRFRIGGVALPAPPVNSLESGSRMIARGFAKRRFFVRLRVGHTLIDALENLFFREPGIFQTADCRPAHGSLAP